MTDKEILIEMFNRNNIKYRLRETDDYYNLADLTLVAKDENVDGYSGFITTFNFDENGNLKNVCISE